MTVIPVNLLSRADLARLGNNVVPVALADHADDGLAAMNRSLGIHGESVDELTSPASFPAGRGRGDRVQ